MTSTLFTSLLVAGSLIGTLTRNINDLTLDTARDEKTIEACTLVSDRGYEASADMRELYLKVPVSAEEEAQLAALMDERGAWTDIDYASMDRSGWPPIQHGLRCCRLAIRYRQTGRSEVLELLHRAMHWWFTARPECPNWWYNEIGLPRAFGPAFLLLGDELTPEERTGAIRVLDRAGLRMTGQNKVWEAGVTLMKGLLSDDEPLVREARDSIASEIRLCAGAEGLQDDWSFHQHGPQLQFGNYGLSYAVSLAWWARALENTPLAFSEEQVRILRDYVRNGLSRVVWQGRFDLNACGRQVFRNTQLGKALCVRMAARNLGLKEKEVRKAQRGGWYFHRSDFGVFRTRNWYASLRMNSERTIGFETVNQENMKGYYSADGALLLRRDGLEYDNIPVLWDWHFIPGATTCDDGTPLWGDRGHKPPFNRSGRVFGATDHGMMAAAMELDRDGLRARKAWFFWKGGVVCLGAGISGPEGVRVYTTLEQSHLRGRIGQSRGGVRHGGISYLPLDDNSYTVQDEEHRGDWHELGPGTGTASGRVFLMYIDHGTAPRDAAYAYAVIPGARSAFRARRIARKVRVVENSAERQVVRIGRRSISIDWDRQEICFSR